MGQLTRSLEAGRRASAMFRTLKRVRVELNPFDHRSTTAREFLRRVRTAPVRRANKDLQIEFVPTEDYGVATIELDYVDGFKQKMECSQLKLIDVMDEVERVARWRGENAKNPFDELRAERAAQLELIGSK